MKFPKPRPEAVSLTTRGDGSPGLRSPRYSPVLAWAWGFGYFAGAIASGGIVTFCLLCVCMAAHMATPLIDVLAVVTALSIPLAIASALMSGGLAVIAHLRRAAGR